MTVNLMVSEPNHSQLILPKFFLFTFCPYTGDIFAKRDRRHIFLQLFTKLVPLVWHMNNFSLQRVVAGAAGYTISNVF
jgi:hypothetical protein